MHPSRDNEALEQLKLALDLPPYEFAVPDILECLRTAKQIFKKRRNTSSGTPTVEQSLEPLINKALERYPQIRERLGDV